MKVQSTSSNVSLNGLTGNARPEKRSQSAQPGAGGAAAVDLSAAARNLAALGDDSADVRTERVQQLRAALESGELSIKPERIADGLLASVRDLLK